MKRITRISSMVSMKLRDVLHRLYLIEDILGTEYDLERLKELVEADREGRIKIDKNEAGKIYTRSASVTLIVTVLSADTGALL